MTRTRIVGGKMTVKVGGDYTINALEGDITTTAAGQNIEVAKQGAINYGNFTAPENKTDLKVTKLEGPFDEDGNKVDFVAREQWYYYKATTNKEIEPNEISLVKWYAEYDNGATQLVLTGGKKLKDGKLQMRMKLNKNSNATKMKYYCYIKQKSEEVKLDIIFEDGEIILVVGTEQHSESYGNKLMFPAQAVREIKNYYSKHNYTNLLIFKDGYTPMELSIIKRDAKRWNKNVYFKMLNTTQDLIDYINNGDATVQRSNKKIGILKIFAHGLPSIFDFGLDGENEEQQRFTIYDVHKLQNTSFAKYPIIYSYACRTGNSDISVQAAMPNYKYNSNWEQKVKPKESLAQVLSNQIEGKVYAFLKRTNYTSTWLDGGNQSYKKDYITIEDEVISNPLNPVDWFRNTWDEALWNLQGAYLPPKVGATPGGELPSKMYVFQKDKEPKETENE